jgi:hypothetical protein
LPPVLVDGGIEPRQVVVRTRDLFLAHPALIAAIGIAVFFLGLVSLVPTTEAAQIRTRRMLANKRNAAQE